MKSRQFSLDVDTVSNKKWPDTKELKWKLFSVSQSRSGKKQSIVFQLEKAQLERDRQVARMRGPEGERARQGLQQPGMRPQFRAPILQTVRHNSPQLSPIQAPRVSVPNFTTFFIHYSGYSK